MNGIARWRRAASNLLLGIALGLLAYYAITTVLASHAQAELRQRTGDVPTFSSEQPERLVASGDRPLDLDGWETQDRAYWASLAEGDVFGRIVIEGIGVDALVMSTVSTAALRKGPGFIEWTDFPGPTGTCGISGHRTTYGAPFRRIDELQPGDTIDLYSPFRLYRYRVVRTLEVTPDQVEVVASTEAPSLTLTACHPPYSARLRLAVQAELVEVRRIEVPED